MRIRRALVAVSTAAFAILGCDGSTGSAAGPDQDATTPPPPGPQPTDAGVVPHDDASAPPDSGSQVDAPPAHDQDAAPQYMKQSVIWVWLGYADALASIVAHKESFTHVSPALYTINYDYTDGVTHLVNGNDDFDGLSSKDVCDRAHSAALKCIPLMYGGAANFGTDQGIQNVLNDAGGAQQNFITSMVGEAVAKGYDGYNLDWEFGSSSYSEYGTKLVTFLGAFKAALNAKHMELSLDVAGFYTRQCSGSGGDGLVDLAAIADNVDDAIIEAYGGALGDTGSACPNSPPTSIDCDKDFAGSLQVMCNSPSHVVSIGLISPRSNSFADQALKSVSTYGFRSVAVWPDDQQFLKADGMPNGASWYSVLADFLAH